MEKYKTFEEMKEELGDNYDRFMYDVNINLINKHNMALNYIDTAQICNNKNEFVNFAETGHGMNIRIILEQGKIKEEIFVNGKER